jgi:multifunctional 2-oxoglutarate metabolism enzyme
MAQDERTTTQERGASGDGSSGGFGVNAWLVDEMYEQYREDPDSLSPSWQEFFEDYKPEGGPSRGPDTGKETSDADEAAAEAPQTAQVGTGRV